MPMVDLRALADRPVVFYAAFGRDGAATPPATRIEMNNGLVVERKGKNSALKVTDPSGQRAGQALLDSFVSAFALDLPSFLGGRRRRRLTRCCR